MSVVNEFVFADNQGPDIKCPEPMPQSTDAGEAYATVNYDAPTVTDLGDPNPSYTCDPGMGAQFDLGSTSVTCTATDNAGNSNSCTFDVEVIGMF